MQRSHLPQICCGLSEALLYFGELVGVVRFQILQLNHRLRSVSTPCSGSLINPLRIPSFIELFLLLIFSNFLWLFKYICGYYNLLGRLRTIQISNIVCIPKLQVDNEVLVRELQDFHLILHILIIIIRIIFLLINELISHVPHNPLMQVNGSLRLLLLKLNVTAVTKFADYAFVIFTY